MEHIALVRKPGGTIAPMFRVYLQGQSTFWDWSSGPLPPSKLADIQRITVSVVSPSSRPDHRGDYAETRLTTDVNSLRNVPNSGRKEYPVDGYVFNDQDHSFSKGMLEPGLPGAVVRLGTYSTSTNAAGYFIFRVPAGSYVIKHVPPSGYGVYTSPDSATLNVAGAPATFSFADTARAGGFVHGFVYNDANTNAIFDASDTPQSGVKLTIAPTGEQ